MDNTIPPPPGLTLDNPPPGLEPSFDDMKHVSPTSYATGSTMSRLRCDSDPWSLANLTSTTNSVQLSEDLWRTRKISKHSSMTPYEDIRPRAGSDMRMTSHGYIPSDRHRSYTDMRIPSDMPVRFDIPHDMPVRPRHISEGYIPQDVPMPRPRHLSDARMTSHGYIPQDIPMPRARHISDARMTSHGYIPQERDPRGFSDMPLPRGLGDMRMTSHGYIPGDMLPPPLPPHFDYDIDLGGGDVVRLNPHSIMSPRELARSMRHLRHPRGATAPNASAFHSWLMSRFPPPGVLPGGLTPPSTSRRRVGTTGTIPHDMPDFTPAKIQSQLFPSRKKKGSDWNSALLLPQGDESSSGKTITFIPLDEGAKDDREDAPKEEADSGYNSPRSEKSEGSSDDEQGLEKTSPKPVDDLDLPSLGSVGHALGTCRSCVFIHKARGCSQGYFCDHCHACGEQEMKDARRPAKRRRDQKARRDQRARQRLRLACEMAMRNI